MPSVEELVERARALVPVVKAHAARNEARRSLMPGVVARLREAGLFRYFQPKRYGGFEMDWGTQYLLAKELARGCPSTAWVVALCGQLSCHAARFPKTAQDEIWGKHDDVVLCQASPPKKGARVRRRKGGFVLDGPQGFTSGIDHATWCLAAPDRG